MQTSAVGRYLTDHHLTQAQAAMILDWTRQRICFIVNGRHDERNLSINAARHIAHTLMGVTLDEYWKQITGDAPEHQYTPHDPSDQPTLRELRNRRQLSQSDIMDTAIVTRTENGTTTHLTVGTSAAYAHKLEVSLEWFAAALERTQDEPPHKRARRARDPHTAGGRLCALRESKQLSLGEVGRRLNGSGASRILDMEVGTRPVTHVHTATGMDLASALEVTVDDLAEVLDPSYKRGSNRDCGSLLAWMERERLSRADVATLMDVSENRVRHWEERGRVRTMPLDKAMSLASLSGVPLCRVAEW